MHRPTDERLALLRDIPKLPSAIIVLAVALAVFAPYVSPHSPIDPDLAVRNRPPALFAGGTSDYPLGTDTQGRDIFSRISFGARIALAVAFSAISIGGVVGTTVGLYAGYRGGWVDALAMRAADVSLAMPAILIALVFVATVGGSFWVVVAILSFALWPRYARLVRGEVLSWKERDFVALAQATGCSTPRMLVVHLFPNVLPTIVVLSTLQIGWTILTEAGLSFLGAGIPPPTPTWGGMVAEGRAHLEELWWLSVIPGTFVALVVLSFNLLGDWMRDALDPKLRQL